MHLGALTTGGRKFLPVLPRFKDFVLGGGTALALQIGHRISVDFDFFSSKPLRKDLLPGVKRILEPRTCSVLVNNAHELTLVADGVKFSFIYYPFPIFLRAHRISGIRMLSPLTIGGTKAYAIGRRGAYKDYVDLYAIFKSRRSSLRSVLRFAEKTFDSEFNARLFLEQMVYLKDVEETPIHFLKTSATKREVAVYFQRLIKGLKSL